MLYAGIDVANRASTVCVVDANAEVIRERTVATEAGALSGAFSGLEATRVVIESAPLAEWVALVVEDAGHEAVVIDARSAKRLMDASKKTDRRDARTLARLAQAGWYTAVHRKSAEARLQRSRLQARQGLVEAYKGFAARVRGLLRAHGVRVGRVSQGEFAPRVRALCAEQVPGLSAYLEPLLAAYEHALGEARRLRRELEREAREHAVAERLASVPGVGPLVSQAYVATLDDPRRFASGDEVADYAGLTPRIYQSGERQVQGRISREGDKLLRWHLVEAAHSLLVRGRDCALRRWGLRLAERKGQAKAKVALARKLAVLLHRLWVSGERFKAWPERAMGA